MNKYIMVVLAVFVLASCGGQPEETPSSSSSNSSSSSSSSGVSLAPVVFSKVPGTQIEAPETNCGTLGVSIETMLVREQVETAIADIFAPLTFDNLSEIVAKLPETEATSEIEEFYLGRMLDVGAELGSHVANNFSELLLDCNADRNCADQFLQKHGSLALSRIMTAEEREAMLTQLYDPESNFTQGIKQLVAGLMISIDFLYQYQNGIDAGGRELLTGEDKARLLGRLLWNSVPDLALLNAVANGELDSEAGYKAQVARMVADDKMKRGVAFFTHEWMHLPVDESPVFADATQEIDLMVQAAFSNGESIRDLFNTRRAFVTPQLADVYGISPPVVTPPVTEPPMTEPPMTEPPVVMPPQGDQCNDTPQCRAIFGNAATDCRNSASPNSVCMCGAQPCAQPAMSIAEAVLPSSAHFEEVMLDDRPGILTRAALLVGTSIGMTSPTVRGEIISSSMLCVKIDEPSPEIQDLFPTLPPRNGKSTRVVAEQTTSPEQCQLCHAKMDPFGFALEHFGADGRFREFEDGSIVIDDFIQTSPIGMLDGYVGLANTIASSDQAVGCYARRWFEHAFKRIGEVGDSCAINNLEQRFIAADGDLNELIRLITENPAMHYRRL